MTFIDFWDKHFTWLTISFVLCVVSIAEAIGRWSRRRKP